MNRIPHNRRMLRPAALVIGIAIALGGCAAQRVHEDAMKLLADGKAREALQQLKKATELDPRNARYRMDYLAQRALLTQALNARGDNAREQGQLDAATAARMLGGKCAQLEFSPIMHRDRAWPVSMSSARSTT